MRISKKPDLILVVLLSILLISNPVKKAKHAYAQGGTNPVTCTTVCDPLPVMTSLQSGATATITSLIAGQTVILGLRIEMVQGAILEALQGHSAEFAQSIQFLAEYLGKFIDSSLGYETQFAKQLKAYQAAQNLSPTLSVRSTNNGIIASSLECQHISSLGGVQSSMLLRAAEGSLSNESSMNFENDSDSIYAYGRASAQRMMFNKWRDNWCVDTTNSGNVPADCGSNRSADNLALQNLDLKISDIMFGATTWPSPEVSQVRQNLMFYFGVRPVNPFNMRDLNNPQVQSAFMKRRSLHARKNLADSVMSYLMAKRVPVMNSGQWLEGIVDLSISDDVQGDSLNAVISDIPDKVSYAQWADIMQSRRFLGTDYLMRVQQLTDGPAENEINKLMAMRLIQLRERYHIMERLLALSAADYAIEVDEHHGADTITIAQ